jgi:hypothetical protein
MELKISAREARIESSGRITDGDFIRRIAGINR